MQSHSTGRVMPRVEASGYHQVQGVVPSISFMVFLFSFISPYSYPLQKTLLESGRHGPCFDQEADHGPAEDICDDSG